MVTEAKRRQYQLTYETKHPERHAAYLKRRLELIKAKYRDDPEWRAKKLQYAKDRAQRKRPQIREQKRNSPVNQATQKAYNRSPERRRYHRNRSLLAKYGITLEEFEILENKQNGVCAICGSKPFVVDRWGSAISNLRVDHDHNTGAVRGLLCFHCNTALGHFRDSVELVKKALAYLTPIPA